MKKINSLSFRIPVIITLISIVLIVIILSIAVNFANIGISKSRFEGFQNTVQAYAKLFDSILVSQIALAKTYSVAPAIIDSLVNRNENTLRNLLNSLKQFNNANEYSINTVVTDLDGNVVMDAIGNTSGSMTDRRPTLWGKLKSNNYEFTFDDKLVTSKDTGVHSIAVGGGIKDSSNNLIGVVFVIIDWKLIHNNYFTDIALGKTGRILAIDSTLTDMMDNLYDQIGSTAVSAYKTVFDNNLSQGRLSYIYMGQDRTGSYTKMKNMNWIVAMSMFDSEIYSTNRDLIIISSIVAIIAIALLAAFVYFYSSYNSYCFISGICLFIY